MGTTFGRWRYEITTGQWFRPDGSPFAFGHCGKGDAMNDPSRVREKGVGPLPPGLYELGPAFRHPKTGPVSMRLLRLPGTETYGRGGFLVHGPNATPVLEDDSEGCPILSRGPREELAATPVRLVEVVAGEGPISIAHVAPDPVDSELEPVPPAPTNDAG